MRYALNVTPINGWETHLGQGQVAMSLSAQGDGFRAFFAVGQTAAMTLAASGAGYLVITGLAQQAALALASSGAGIKALTGAGAAAQALLAVGVPVLEARPVGEGAMALTVSGAARKALLGSGIAAQALGASGRGYLVLIGQADAADIALTAEGDGFAAFFGEGEPASLALSAGGAGYSELRGLTEPASLALDGAGTAYLQLKPIGQSDLEIAAGDASIKNIATLGTGLADMLMVGIAGIPRPIVIPAEYTEAHPSRFFIDEPTQQRIDAGEPIAPIPVPRDQRTFVVPAERNVA